MLSFEWPNLWRRKSLTFILSLLKRERRNNLRADAKHIPFHRNALQSGGKTGAGGTPASTELSVFLRCATWPLPS